MKRISAIVLTVLLAVTMLAPACFAAKDAADTEPLKIVASTPSNGDKGVSVENLSVKLTFNKDMAGMSKQQKDHNQSVIKLTDPKGKKIGIKAYYSKEHPNMVMIVSGTSGNKLNRFDSATEYTLALGKTFAAADGSVLGDRQEIAFTTINQNASMKVYMVLMGLMMVGMIFFTTRSAKKAAEKEMKEKGVTKTVNPYKEAKRTGKSVEEIVAADKKKKEKAAEAAAKKRAAELAIEEEILAQERKAHNKRVAVKRPISAAGSEYKVTVVETKKPEPKKKSTNPKGQTGKQKNKKGGKKKKK